MTMTSPLKFTVLVSSYNYRDYVVQAVESALAQTLPPHEVIVVDDGSTDDSLAVLRARFGQTPAVQILSQPNRGQLAAWIAGFEGSSGDVIALLDSDDLWEPGYLAGMARVYEHHQSVDVVYCNMVKFGARQGLMLQRRWHRRDRDLGTSVLLGCFHPRWQGNATSANTARRALMARILELPSNQVAEWRTRPDDCLFYGSDILGGHKYYLAAALARHREHASNALLMDRHSPVRRMRYELRRERMLAHYRGMAAANPRLLTLAKSEFRTKPHPVASEWWLYTCMAIRAPQRFSMRLGQILAIAGHYLASLLRPR
jgi:glycosyltransferase involved in cell wall biosynthesis